MFHLRVIVPTELSAAVRDLLLTEPGVAHLVVWPGVAVQPEGDVVACDLARESASSVLAELRALGVDDRGSIALEDLDVLLSRSADEAERAAPGAGADSVVWEEIEEATSEESTLSVTFLAFLVVATMIAACGVLLDNPILIVGAMVVGPEFGPLAGLCVAAVQRRPRLAARSGLALLVGFPVAMLATMAFTGFMHALGLFDEAMLERDRPLTEFIYQPDWLSFWVAFLAGIAGLLSLTSAKSGALIGVLISVTTVPAAANAAVAISYGDFDEAGGSLGQLGLNLVGIVLAGTLTLLVQRGLWSLRESRTKRRPRSVRTGAGQGS
ncbi:DUF389 domain-containing protein [Streptomyces sp. SID3343]|uniref:DUF389 domain-containing protein n=1 Tax=Streptomyces sp. SID3343 TaxID=2690260 RepID=UPI001371B8CA|nr:DUF389 domain-containing protein [Streptomyces sp. SID3343]MYW06150.1 DUF389 domain-containing protein [Streptomyces sp. SID3343]